jgi:hypothetical protein
MIDISATGIVNIVEVKAIEGKEQESCNKGS